MAFQAIYCPLVVHLLLSTLSPSGLDRSAFLTEDFIQEKPNHTYKAQMLLKCFINF